MSLKQTQARKANAMSKPSTFNDVWPAWVGPARPGQAGLCVACVPAFAWVAAGVQERNPDQFFQTTFSFFMLGYFVFSLDLPSHPIVPQIACVCREESMAIQIQRCGVCACVCVCVVSAQRSAQSANASNAPPTNSTRGAQTTATSTKHFCHNTNILCYFKWYSTVTV